MRSVSSVSLVRRPWRLLAEVSALLIAVVVAFPLYWMVLSAFALVLFEVVWCSFPFVMVTVYAGIKAIPGEVLEAASLDGASQWRIWRSVTAPMLRPILVVVTIQSVIWDFKVFTQIYVMTNGGGIAGQNLVLNVYAYQKAFASSQYSLGSAIGVVMLVILLAVTLVYLRLVRRQGEEL